MDERVIMLLTAFGGIILGSTLTFATNYVLQKSKMLQEEKSKKENLLREKLEDLYLLSEEYFNYKSRHYLTYIGVMEGNITMNQALDMQIEMGDSSNKNDPRKMQMLIDLYFHTLKDQYEIIVKQNETMNRVANDFKEQYKTGDFNGEKHLAIYLDTYKKIIIEEEKFNLLVIELSEQTKLG
jgi:hypothetical protein